MVCYTETVWAYWFLLTICAAQISNAITHLLCHKINRKLILLFISSDNYIVTFFIVLNDSIESKLILVMFSTQNPEKKFDTRSNEFVHHA